MLMSKCLLVNGPITFLIVLVPSKGTGMITWDVCDMKGGTASMWLCTDLVEIFSGGMHAHSYTIKGHCYHACVTATMRHSITGCR